MVSLRQHFVPNPVTIDSTDSGTKRQLASLLVLRRASLFFHTRYDVLGNLVQSVDRQGRMKVYEYDELFRPRREYWYDELGALQNTITTSYDVLNRVAAVADDFSSCAYGYDALDRVVSETVANPGIPPVTLTTAYDRLDGLRSSFSATVDGVGDFQTTYAYDAMLRMTDVTQTGQGGNAVADKHVTFTYNDNSQFDLISRYASTGTSNLVATTDYQYDSSNRLTVLTHAQGATTLAAYTWTFDAANRLVGQTPPDGAVSYSYDSRSQLTGADYDYQDDESYVYDENGNRISATNESSGTDAYPTGDHNRLAFDGTYTYSYDSEGNRTARFIDLDANGALSAGDTEVTEYTWDVANRLTRIVERATADGPATKVFDYVYDLYGRRISKQLDNDGDGVVDYSESYVYDATDVVLDFVDSDGDGPVGGGLAKRYLWGAAVDQLLAQEDVLWGTGAPEDIAWPLPDHLGTTRDVVDSTGAILTHFQIDAFGSILLGDVGLIRYIYTTQEYDPESGLHFYDARYYDSAVAKFISDDPIGITAGDANFSRYLGNAATSSIDPSGFDETEFTAEGRVAHAAIKEWFVERFGVGGAKFEQTMPRDFPVLGKVKGRVDVVRGRTVIEIGPTSTTGVPAKLRQVESLKCRQREVIL
jgi:RHS repeat-associated protein